MASDDRPTLPPPGRPVPGYPAQRRDTMRSAGADDPAAVRLADELERARVARLEAEQMAKAAAETLRAIQEAREAQEQAEAAKVGKSIGPAALRVQIGDLKGWAALLTALGGLGLGGSAWLAKAPAPQVEAQGKKIDTAIVPEQGRLVERVGDLERFALRQRALNRAEMNYVIQVLAESKVAIVTRYSDLPPMDSIQTSLTQQLPGRPKSPPMLVVETPYPTLEYVEIK